MSLESTVADGRAFQAAQFLSACTIVRDNGAPTFDPNTGSYTQPTTTVYMGTCQIRPAERIGSDIQTGEREANVFDYEARLPVDTAVAVGDTLTVTASTYDAGMVGKVFRISDLPYNDLQIARVAILEKAS